MTVSSSNWHHVVTALSLAVAGFVVGANLSTTHQAHAEVTAAPEIPAFQSGGQMSVPILREISATLRQMDARLARLETAAQKIQMNSSRGGAIARPAGGNQ